MDFNLPLRPQGHLRMKKKNEEEEKEEERKRRG